MMRTQLKKSFPFCLLEQIKTSKVKFVQEMAEMGKAYLYVYAYHKRALDKSQKWDTQHKWQSFNNIP